MNAVNSVKSSRLEELGRTVRTNNRSNWLLSDPPTVPNAAYLPFQNQICKNNTRNYWSLLL